MTLARLPKRPRRNPLGGRIALVAVVAHLLAATARAQEPAGDEPVPPPPRVRQSAVVMPAEGESKAAPSDPLKRFLDFSDVVFLLYPDLDKFQDPNWIIIPNNLWEKYLEEQLAKRAAPKEAWVITDFALRGSLGEPFARLEARITVRVEDPRAAGKEFRPAEIELRLDEANCDSARAGSGERPSLRKQPNGPFLLTLDRPGIHTVTLGLFVEIDRTPTDQRLALTLPRAGVKSVELTSPEPVVTARDGRSGRDLTIAEDRKTIRPDLRTDDSLQVTWRSAAASESAVAATHVVNGTLSYRLDETEIETESVLVVEAATDAREWTFQVPAGERIRSASVERRGAPIPVQTEVASAGEGVASLKLRFGEPVLGSVTLRILSTRPRPPEEAPIEVGRWDMKGAQAQTGRIEVFTGADLRIRFFPKTTLQRVAPAQLTQGSRGTRPHRAFRYASQPAMLELLVENARPILAAATALEVTVGVEAAEVQGRIRFSARQAHTEKLGLRVPIDMTELQIAPRELVEVESIRPNTATGMSDVVLALAEPTIGDVTVQIKGLMPTKPLGEQVLRLPAPAEDIEQTGTVAVRAAPNVKLGFVAEKTKNLRREPIPPSEDLKSEPLWYFRAPKGPAELAFTLERLARAVEVAVESRFRRTPVGIRVTSEFRYRSRHEPMDEVDLRVPEGIQHVSVIGDKIGAGGEVSVGPVTYPLTNPADRCELTVAYDYPIPSREGSEVHVPLVLPADASVVAYKGEVYCDANLLAAALPPWESSQPTPAAPGSAPDAPRLVVGSREPPDTLGLVFERTGSLAALFVPRILVEEVVTDDGQRLGYMAMLVERHRAASMALEAPVGCQLTSVLVNGVAVAPQPLDAGQWRVPLPTSDLPCAVEVSYARASGRSLGAWERVELALPRLDLDAAVGQTRWVIRGDPDRLFVSAKRGARADLNWRFRGFLAQSGPDTGTGSAAGLDWLREAAPTLAWSGGAFEGLNDERFSRAWGFETRGQAAGLVLYSFHEPFWVLLNSGAVLVVGLAVSRQPLERRLWFGFLAVAIAVGFWAVAPTWGAWVWLGAQWGFLLVALTLGARWLAARRRRRRYALGPIPRAIKEGNFSSSLLRRLQGAAADGTIGQPAGQVGAAVDSK